MRAKLPLSLAALALAASSLVAPVSEAAGAAVPAGSVAIGGDALSRPLTLTVKQLAELPAKTLTVNYLSDETPVTKTFKGALLSDVLALVRLKPATAPKNPNYRLAVTALATDAYQVTIAYAEIDPAAGNKQALLAYEEDGQNLSGVGPRLVMPGDVKGGRQVSWVSSLTVSQLPVAPAAGNAGDVSVSGLVKTPATVTMSELQALDQKTTTVTVGGQALEEEGPLLSDVLDEKAGGINPPAAKEALLRLIVAASAGDDQAGVGIGEIDPGYGNVPAILSLKENNVALSAPRLIVPGDNGDGRMVKNIHSLHVANPDPSATVPPAISDRGVRLITRTGLVTGAGGASSRGDLTGKTLTAPIVAADTAEVPDQYWMAGADGGVFNFGGAPFYGSMGGMKLNLPVVDIAASPTGKGYWMAASDGGVFNFGDAGFFGSTGSMPLNKPVVDIISSPSGKGYLLIAADGGVFAFGDAVFSDSLGARTLVQPIVDGAATPSGQGYYLLAADGGVFAFGDAVYLGRDPSTAPDAVKLVLSATGKGYRIVHKTATVTSIGDLPQLSKTSVNGEVVAATA